MLSSHTLKNVCKHYTPKLEVSFIRSNSVSLTQNSPPPGGSDGGKIAPGCERRLESSSITMAIYLPPHTHFL